MDNIFQKITVTEIFSNMLLLLLGKLSHNKVSDLLHTWMACNRTPKCTTLAKDKVAEQHILGKPNCNSFGATMALLKVEV